MKKSLIFLILPLLFAPGCGDDRSPVDVSQSLSPEEAQVIANSLTVQQAVEAFAAENGGVYPGNVAVHTTPSGNTVIDLLPGGTFLMNPFTLIQGEPHNGLGGPMGETGYVPDGQGGPVYVSYQITGSGADSVIITLTPPTPLSPEEAQVIANCYLVQNAVEAFAAQDGGVYPSNVAVAVTPSGQTVLDLLPGGMALVNPFTGGQSEPVNGVAVIVGQTGYSPIYQGQILISYSVTGFGADSVIITLTPW